MTLKQNLLTRAGIIFTTYILMSAPMWWHVPHWRTDFFTWFKFWHGMVIDWKKIWNNIDNVEQYVTQDTLYTSVIGVIVIFLTLIYRPDPARFAYGRAVWANGSQLKKMGLNFSKGLVVGKFRHKLLFMDKPLSVLLLAPPGTGKTAGIVIPSVLLCEHSLVIHDPKGEIYDLTYQHKEKHSKVLVFDPTKSDCAKFNIFAKSILPQSQDEVYSYIRNISKILVRSYKEENNDFFTQEAQNIFTFFASWLIWKHGETSLPAIRKMLLSDKSVEKVIYTMCPSLEGAEEEENDEGGDSAKWDIGEAEEAADNIPTALLELARGILSNTSSSKQWAAVIGVLRQSLDVFQSEMVANATSGDCEFTAQKLRECPHTVYLKVQDIDKERLAPLMAMVFSSLTRNLLSSLPNEGDNIVTFILDEFVRFGRLDTVVDMPAIGRGYQFNAMFIAQDYGQITDLYSKDKLSAIESNTAYKIVLAQNNFQTAKQISDLIGFTTRIRKSESVSRHTKDLANRGQSQSSTKEAALLVSPQDVVNLPHGKGILLVQNYFKHPVRIDLPFYFKQSALKRLNNG